MNSSLQIILLLLCLSPLAHGEKYDIYRVQQVVDKFTKATGGCAESAQAIINEFHNRFPQGQIKVFETGLASRVIRVQDSSIFFDKSGRVTKTIGFRNCEEPQSSSSSTNAGLEEVRGTRE